VGTGANDDAPRHAGCRGRRRKRTPDGRLTSARVIIETFVLPLAFGAVALAIIMTALWWTVLAYKIKLEDQTLEARRAA